MKIIISPAKKIKMESEMFFEPTSPIFLERAKILVQYLKQLPYDGLKELLACNDDIAQRNYERYQNMSFDKNLYHALLMYDGIQYKYMAPLIFDNKCFDYVSKHLCILSGLYGILYPMDTIEPYRLEMQAKLKTNFCKNLYNFWGSSVYEELTKHDKIILNLASKEYSKIIEPYLEKDIQFVSCSFLDENKKTGKFTEKGVYAKMARGEMVRFMAENEIESLDRIKDFTRLQYSFNKDLSTTNNFVFVR